MQTSAPTMPELQPADCRAGLHSCAAHGSASRSNYRTILADPPWLVPIIKSSKAKWNRPAVPYPMMTTDAICALPIADLAADDCHLWLWTCNSHIEDGFRVMRAWGFKYLAPITWVKPNGNGAWWQHRTQVMLMGYRRRLVMSRVRCAPTVGMWPAPRAHSVKPLQSYELIESISEPARIEIFARPWTPLFPRREGWDMWGNEAPNSVELVTPNSMICGKDDNAVEN